MEQIIQWWIPKSLSIFSASMDFKVDGFFHYGIKSPEGYESWGKFTYREIAPHEKIVFTVHFSDEQGQITRHPISPNWPAEILNTINFHTDDQITTIHFSAIPFQATEIEIATFEASIDILKSGFQATFDQLDQFLKQESVIG
ncbi:MAG: SRPBCC domain-containing protein [Bacteroidetes bacterium]|nr:SRPBCC domain-containing protein [Bacteroidota bacterium]